MGFLYCRGTLTVNAVYSVVQLMSNRAAVGVIWFCMHRQPLNCIEAQCQVGQNSVRNDRPITILA